MSDLLKAIRDEAQKGRIVYRSIDGLHRVDEREFIKQSADGILYDLNRGEETTATDFDEYRGVNDYAVARTIRALKERISALEACPPLKWVKSDKYEAWTAEIFGIFYSIHLCTDGTYRAGSIGPKPQWFPTLEEAKAACEDHWAKYWEEEMKTARG